MSGPPSFQRNKETLEKENISCAPSVPSAAAPAWRRRQDTSIQVLQRCVFSSTFLTLKGRYEQNGLVHVLFRQWELSLGGCIKVWSGLGRTVRWIMGWGTTDNSLFLPVLTIDTLSLQKPVVLPCMTSPFHYIAGCVSTVWSECYDGHSTKHVHACEFRWPEDVCMSCCMNGDIAVSWYGIYAFGESDRYINVATVQWHAWKHVDDGRHLQFDYRMGAYLLTWEGWTMVYRSHIPSWELY